MIRLVGERGITRVAAFCDTCNLEITDGEMAVYEWDSDDAEQPGGTTNFRMVHTGECAGPRQTDSFMMLRDFCVYLTENLNVDYAEARRIAESGI